MARCHLQRIAEAKACDRIVGPQLGNNGRELDGVIVAALFKQRVSDVLEGKIVERLQVSGGLKPD